MSRPRAATSVATSSSSVAGAERLHHAVALLLRACPPWSASARMPRPFRLSVSSSTSGACGRRRSPTSGSRDRARGRAPRACGRARRRTPSAAPSAACRRPPASLRDRDPHRVVHVLRGDRGDPGGRVAENSAVWRVFGVASRIASRSSAKPMSSISSASSRTTPAHAAELERACGACGRARGRAWRPRRRRRASSARSCVSIEAPP